MMGLRVPCTFGLAGLIFAAALFGCEDQRVLAPKPTQGGWTQATVAMPLFIENYTRRNIMIRSVVETFSEIRRIDQSNWFAPDTAGKTRADQSAAVFATVPDDSGEVLYYTLEIAIGNDSPCYALIQLTPMQYEEALEATGCRVVLKPQGIRVFIGKQTWRLNWIRPFPAETLEPNFVSPRRAPKL